MSETRSVDAPTGTRRDRSLIIPAVLTLAVLIALGTWQLERRAWKEGLIATLVTRIDAPPADLPADWDRLDRAADEFRRVRFAAMLLNDQEALVYTPGSNLRTDISGPGYWVFTPARLANGGLVVVNRGFVPEGRQDPRSRAAGQVAGEVEIVGALRWPEARGLFTPADDPGRNLWFVRDHTAMAAAKNWGAVAAFFIDQEAPQPPGGLPKPGKITPNLPNNHLQYALTWYGLALLIAVMVGVLTVNRRRERHAGGSEKPPN